MKFRLTIEITDKRIKIWTARKKMEKLQEEINYGYHDYDRLGKRQLRITKIEELSLL